MITKKSINAAKKLIELYNGITVEQVKEFEKSLWHHEDYYGEYIAGKITGFGRQQTCLLCNAVNDCSRCIYANGNIGCIRGENEETYRNIKMAANAEELVSAFKARASHIQSILNNLKKGE